MGLMKKIHYFPFSSSWYTGYIIRSRSPWTTDKDARKEIYKQVEDIVQDACAYIPLYSRDTVTAWNKDLNYTPTVTVSLIKDMSWN